MARLITTGVEINSAAGSNSPEPGAATGISIDNVTFRSGLYSLFVDLTVLANANSTLTFAGAAGTTFYARSYVNFSQITTSVTSTHKAGVLGDGTVLVGIGLNNTGRLQFQPPGGGNLTGATYTPALNTWYRLEFGYQSTSGAWEWRVNGSTIDAGTTTSASTPGSLRLGNFSGSGTVTYKANFDDIALNDTTAGAGQTSWPGDGKVLLLLPASDNAVGTGWTNDAAGTTNLFNAVNNTPPIGIADTSSGTGLNQIRNATSNANVNYDANLTSYAAAGIAAGDTVNLVFPLAATAAPVTTSAKQGTVGMASNPAIANVALSSTGTAGAFWQGNAASTFGSGWKWSLGTLTYLPTVTVGTAPVARITQVTASTRIAMVCALCMYVDYTPATAFTPVPTHLPFV